MELAADLTELLGRWEWRAVVCFHGQRPLSRDDRPSVAPSPRSASSATFASSYSENRSKRSLCVDLKTAEGLAIVHKLAETADVLVQNFRPGAIERMGLGEDIVRELRPDIVFVSISGFGESGPYVHQRVYDSVIQALCGLCDIQTDNETGRPQMVRTIVPDKTTSVTAAQAITAALFARERTGKG